MSVRSRWVAGGTAVVTAFALLGGGYARFGASDATDAQVIQSGTTEVACDGGTFGTPIPNVAGGDTASRALALRNAGTTDFAPGSVTLLPVSTGGTLLTTSPDGVRLTIESAGRTVLPSTVISSWSEPLVLDLAESELAAGALADLTFLWSLPSTAPNALQGLTDTVSFRCDAEQAGGTGGVGAFGLDYVGDEAVDLGSSLEGSLVSTGAVGARRYAITSGPAWLTVDPATGTVGGTPPAAGTYPVTASMTDSRGRTATTTFEITASAVTPTKIVRPTISTTTAADGGTFTYRDEVGAIYTSLGDPARSGGLVVRKTTPNGAADTSFGVRGTTAAVTIPGITEYPGPVTVQSNGKIMLAFAGTLDTATYATRYGFARFNSDGTLDRTYGGGTGYMMPFTSPSPTFTTMSLRAGEATPDGGTIFVGAGSTPNLSETGLMVKLDAAGAPVSTFGSGGMKTLGNQSATWLADVTVSDAGVVYAVGGAGTRTYTPDYYQDRVTEYSRAVYTVAADGSFTRRTFRTGTHVPSSNCAYTGRGCYSVETADQVEIDAQGRMLVSGRAQSGDGISTQTDPAKATVTRFLASGALDASYGVGGTLVLTTPSGGSYVTTIDRFRSARNVSFDVLDDGRLLVDGGGQSPYVASTCRDSFLTPYYVLAAADGKGSTPLSAGAVCSSVPADPYATYVLGDGRVYAAGDPRSVILG